MKMAMIIKITRSLSVNADQRRFRPNKAVAYFVLLRLVAWATLIGAMLARNMLRRKTPKQQPRQHHHRRCAEILFGASGCVLCGGK